ncbi:MAG: hypothetical protein J5944_14430 [Lentisphaeria bacterium]|nr:hypothetical protein [Lentisphaeria bacterium]
MKTTLADLPTGKNPPPVSLPHFPTRFQAFVWRNWGLVPADILAGILSCSADEVKLLASGMGLDPHAPVDEKWRKNGYLTLIRNNWHLLNYEQLLQLLEWTPERMLKALREEDFLFAKLGRLKPDCEKLSFRKLTDGERDRTARIRDITARYFPPDRMERTEKPFAFADAYHPCPVSGNDRFAFNYIHSYAASCGDVFLDADRIDPVPENLLEQYASMGVRGVWMHAVLYLLEPIPGAEEFSAGWEKRMENLKRVSDTCEKHGLKLYLYLNEPRTMPDAFYDKKPEWRGIKSLSGIANCISRTPEVLQWLEHACGDLFARFSGLGGIYVIAMSENTTHCNCRMEKHLCPICKDLPDDEFLIRIISAMERGIHHSNPKAKVIFSDWAWSFEKGRKAAEFKKKVIARLPKGICYATISEWGKPTSAGGIEGSVVDYSISQPGPAPENAELLTFAKTLGLETLAKVQINNSWELSAVPYIPVPYLIEEHLHNLEELQVDGLMLSWTLGGFPGGNLELLRKKPDSIAADKFHPELASVIRKVWKQFGDAFREFPFHVGTLYTAPMNYGPQVPFYPAPTGYRASMIGFPYDDLESWRAIYPADIFENQFRKLSAGWKKGLDDLRAASGLVRPEERPAYEELERIASAAWCHFASTLEHIRFVRAREKGDREIMADAVRNDRERTLELYEIVRKDSRIGFEASNHYYYTLNDLREKILNCEWILAHLDSIGQQNQHGR